MELFADIIVDISCKKLDQTCQYRIPETLKSSLEPGNVVEIPFGRGNRMTKGYVLRITDYPSCPLEKMKWIEAVATDFAGTDSKLTALALWMRDYYGCTAVQALRTVLPFRQKAAVKEKRTVTLQVSHQEAQQKLELFRHKHQAARARLLEALLEDPMLPYEVVTGSLKITPSVLRALEQQKLISCEHEQVYRRPELLQNLGTSAQDRVILNYEQQEIVDAIESEWEEKEIASYLIHGVTGSGKTAVYMELIARTVARGKQAILLIPEISLTYQNVLRFYHRFGDRISVLHSRLSQAERYDQFERARQGDIDVMIGPRSALFTPFQKLGMIIVDEEHETSYKSEQVPRYHARETARKRAVLEGAKLVLGSATPSLEAYYEAQMGESRLFTLKERAAGGMLPEVITADMREELKAGNRSVFSRILTEKIGERLKRGEQVMLFLNRRGYAGFVSCRSCGHVMKCPHCDVSLSLHQGRRLVCHYCGYEEPAVGKCPTCGSPFIGGFKVGTQQVVELVQQVFPNARILRMDADTTKGKDGHAELLRAFAQRDADILVGTQMIVKGHDFPLVTLVGILAADLSLNMSDYEAAERTFQLLTQAAGRAGRGKMPGEVVIQTYEPEHYAVACAAAQDYDSFYEQEMRYRQLAGYPPLGDMMTIHCASEQEQQLGLAVTYLAKFVRQLAGRRGVTVIGPADETVSKVNDVYRKAMYLKHADFKVLTSVKNIVEQYVEMNEGFKDISVQFERR